MDKAQIVERLKDWKNDEEEIADNMLRYFEDFPSWNDVDIAAEGVMLLNVMFGMDIETDSPVYDTICGITAQGAEGAFAMIAKMLGVDINDLKEALFYWQFFPEDSPPCTLTLEDIRGCSLSDENGGRLRRKIMNGFSADEKRMWAVIYSDTSVLMRSRRKRDLQEIG